MIIFEKTQFLFYEENKSFVIHIDPLGRPSHGSDHCFRTSSVRPSPLSQNKFQVKTMFATYETVGLAEWIIDDTCQVIPLNFQELSMSDRTVLLRGQIWKTIWKRSWSIRHWRFEMCRHLWRWNWNWFCNFGSTNGIGSNVVNDPLCQGGSGMFFFILNIWNVCKNGDHLRSWLVHQ